MTLLEIGPDFKVLLNKDWLLTIPVFRKLIHRDKGSIGDVDGRKKYKAIKEFTYIYHFTDPRSPLENYETIDRMQKALQYAEIKEKDIDKDILDAITEYEELLANSVPTLELLRAAKSSKTHLIKYFKNIDFEERDKKGGEVNKPSDLINNISKLKTLHLTLIDFENLVHSELKENKGVRGKTELGDRETKGKQHRKWMEGGKEDTTTITIEDDPYAEYTEAPAAAPLKNMNANAPSFFGISSLNSKID